MPALIPPQNPSDFTLEFAPHIILHFRAFEGGASQAFQGAGINIFRPPHPDAVPEALGHMTKALQ